MRLVSLALVVACLPLLASCQSPSAAPPAAAAKPAAPATYAMSDFAKVRKFDAHVHANTDSPALIEQAKADNFELLTINVDYPDFPPIAEQQRIARKQAGEYPGVQLWAATFSMRGFGSPAWAQKTEAGLADAVTHGARAVKIWKNVGMVEKGADGKLVMLDDPGLAPIAESIAGLGVPLIDHQGEPYNCWLPLEQMTSNNDREYFSKHPQYHMYLHPEQPRYEDLMQVRDRFVSRHPKLQVVGAHLGSLEWSVDRMAAFLDAHPNAVLDMAARMGQVQYQSVRDHAKVRDFLIKYQDRILYATDLTFNPGDDAAVLRKSAHETWENDWKYLATGETQRVDVIDADVRGLALPRGVIDKLYYANAQRVFAAPGNAAR